MKALGRAGSNLRRATIDHVLTAVEELRVKRDGTLATPAIANFDGEKLSDRANFHLNLKVAIGS